MIVDKSYLKYLIGQTVRTINTDINTLSSLKRDKDNLGEEVMSVYTQMNFDEYRLNIYNKSEIVGRVDIKDLIGLTVIDSNETNENAELVFNNGYRL